jgi:aspartyl-tRNA(Asn)/glutamyl-tRNA(Gln) amidotransferase subunit A
MSQENLVARTQAYLDVIEAANPVLKAMISVNPAALSDAAAIAKAAVHGNLPGAGLIVSLKDNIDTAGLRTTMGSAFFTDHVPTTDAPVTERLRRAGCVIIGKNNLHEFAFGGTTQNPHHGLGRNPWNPDAIPGGSSGGSGSAVGAGMCDVSLGTDTGGSIRIPAALNGVAGLRPTHGSVPNTGCYPVSAAYDTIGPLARTVAEVARVHELIAGPDAGDDCTGNVPIQSWANLYARGVKGLRIGVPESWALTDLDPDVLRLMKDAIGVLRDLGAIVSNIDLPEAPDAQRFLMPMVHADAASVHADHLRDAPGTFGADVLSRLTLGKDLSSREYAEGMRFKERWLRRLEGTFTEVDVVLTPTVPVTAPMVADSAKTLATTRGISRFTYAWALAGTPALSVPVGFASNGLPAAMQLVAPRWHDARVLALGAHYQTVTDHHLKRPSMAFAKG